MKNSEKNEKFLSSTDAPVRDDILANIAEHYGITSAQAFEEVTDEDAEHLLDYMTEPSRTAALIIMRRRGLS